MPKLSDFHPNDVEVVEPAAKSGSLKLSDFHPNDVQVMPEATPEVSTLESLLRGGVNQLGAAPVVGAAFQHPIEAFKAATNPLARLAGAKESSPEETKEFDKARSESQASFKAAENAHPYAYGAGNLVGSLPLMALAPEAAPGILGGAKLGAGLGAITGIGTALSEGQDVGGITKSAIGQGAVGGVVGGAIGGITKALSPSSLEESASKNAVEAFNPPKSEVTKMRQSPAVTDSGVSRLQEVGSALNKPTEWLNGESVIKATGNPQEHLDRLLLAQKNSGEFLGTVANTLDEKLGPSFDSKPIIDYIDELQKPMLSRLPESRAAGLPKQSYVDDFNALHRIKQDILEFGNNPLSFADAEEIKKDISRLAYKADGAPGKPEFVQLRGFMNDKLEDAIDAGAKQLDDPALFQKYLDAKNLYGATRQMEKSAQGNVSKEISNRDLGITDFMLGTAGYGAHGGPGAVAAIAAKKGLESKYNTLAAKGQQWSADTMRNMSTKISDLAPEQLVNFGSKLRSSSDQTAQKLGNILGNMAEKDQTGRNAAIFSIMQIPAYRNLMHSLTSNQ